MPRTPEDRDARKVPIAGRVNPILFRRANVLIQSGQIEQKTKSDLVEYGVELAVEKIVADNPDIDDVALRSQWNEEAARQKWEFRENTLISFKKSLKAFRRNGSLDDLLRLKLRSHAFRTHLPPNDGRPFRKRVDGFLADLEKEIDSLGSKRSNGHVDSYTFDSDPD